MRIIAGEYRGRKIKPPTGKGIKPTPDRIRENLFNITREDIPNAKVLDLFTGTGIIGIEFLSRGAAFTVFSDKAAEAVRLAGENLETLRCDKAKYRLVHGDCLFTLRLLKNEKFNIIFMDPPYNEGYYDDCIKAVFAFDMLDSGGYIVAEHYEKVTLKLPENAVVMDERHYGTIKLTFIKKAEV